MHCHTHTHTHIYTVHGNHIFGILFTPLCLAICIGIACLYLSCSGLLPIICNTPLPTLCGAFLAFLFSLIDVVYLLVLLGARGKRMLITSFAVIQERSLVILWKRTYVLILIHRNRERMIKPAQKAVNTSAAAIHDSILYQGVLGDCRVCLCHLFLEGQGYSR